MPSDPDLSVAVQYRFAIRDVDHSYLSPGRALRTRRESPAFPVRLVEEAFLQCREYLAGEGRTGPYTVYDPCCGTAYLLTVLGVLFNRDISLLIGSDIDPEALELAVKNLGLLSGDGLSARADELRVDGQRYNRASAHEALESCRVLRGMLAREIPARTFRADALTDNLTPCLGDDPVDMVLTDIPHGSGSFWQPVSSTAQSHAELAERFLSALVRSLGSSRPVIAVASQKRLFVQVPGATRLRRFTVGKRQVLFFRVTGDWAPSRAS